MPTEFEGNGHRGPSSGPAGARARTPSWRRRSLVLGLLAAWFSVGGGGGFFRFGGWVGVGTLRSVEYFRVVYVAELQVFVVAGGDHPVALSAASPHLGERLMFCRTAGLFEDGHGDLFDRFGLYVAGPAPRGMDRVGVRIKGDDVDVKPGSVTPGPPRGSGDPLDPIGPICRGWDEEPSGFFRLPPPPPEP
jgi:hypothetical protein